MEKNILLIGAGRFGRHIAEKLMELGHEVMIADKDEHRIDIVKDLVTAVRIGDSTERDFLASLGVRSFDVCIVAIGDDFQSSLETVWLLKNELGARRVIARASRDMQEKFLLNNGADEVVYPEKQMAAQTAIQCSSETILSYYAMDDGYALCEVQIPRAWLGKTVLELNVRKRYGVTILGFRDNGRMNMNVTADTLVDTETSVLVLGPEKLIHKHFDV